MALVHHICPIQWWFLLILRDPLHRWLKKQEITNNFLSIKIILSQTKQNYLFRQTAAVNSRISFFIFEKRNIFGNFWWLQKQYALIAKKQQQSTLKKKPRQYFFLIFLMICGNFNKFCLLHSGKQKIKYTCILIHLKKAN